MSVQLGYGRNTVPEGITTAWGARWIAPDDYVWDRQSWRGDDQRPLVEWLNRGALAGARAEARRLFESGQWDGGSEDERVLFEDAEGKVVGSPQRSFGYVYVAAWLEPTVTPGGRVLTNDDLEALADEAERERPGYVGDDKGSHR